MKNGAWVVEEILTSAKRSRSKHCRKFIDHTYPPTSIELLTHYLNLAMSSGRVFNFDMD